MPSLTLGQARRCSDGQAARSAARSMGQHAGSTCKGGDDGAYLKDGSPNPTAGVLTRARPEPTRAQPEPTRATLRARPENSLYCTPNPVQPYYTPLNT